MDLITGEKSIMSSDADTLVLTSHRVRYDAAKAGKSKLISITLDAVASCGLVTRSWPLLLILAAVVAVIAFLFMYGNSQKGLFVVAIILAVAYFATRSSALSVCSNGGERIVVPVKGMGRQQIVEFVQAVEEAKLIFMGRTTLN